MPRALAWVKRHPSSGWLLAAAAFVVVAVGIGYNGQPFQQYSRETFVLRHELYTVIALGMVLPALFAEPGRGFAGRVLGNRVLAYLGLISYGIYLWHHAVLDQIVDWIGDDLPVSIPVRLLVYVPLAVAGSVLIASISYYVVERPALSLKRLVPFRTPAARGESVEEPTPATPSGSPR